MRLLITATSFAIAIVMVGCNQSANSNTALENHRSTPSNDRTTVAKPSSPSSDNPNNSSQANNIAQSNTTQANTVQGKQAEQSQSTAILDGRYLVGHTGQGLEVEGDRYRYTDEEGEQPWRSITELTAIKKGVIYDGNSHWCLNTMKSREQVGSCSKEGWVIYQPSTLESTSLKIPALEKEMTYEQARQLILDAGWQPLVTTTDNPQDGTKPWRDRGYDEVSSCSGTGMGFCRFEFTGLGDRKLVVVTGGSESTLQQWWEE